MNIKKNEKKTGKHPQQHSATHYYRLQNTRGVVVMYSRRIASALALAKQDILRETV